MRKRRRSRRPSAAYANRLYRNDGQFRFTDVTEAPACAGIGYAMGAAAADYDNDGHVDLFVAGVRQNQLLHNRGDGRFEDVTARSGIASGDWAVAGRLVRLRQRRPAGPDGRQLREMVARNQSLLRRSGAWDSRSTVTRDPFRGCRTGCIATAATARSKTSRRAPASSTHIGKGMSVAFADYDHDGRLDMFVTNDTVPNFLFHNKGDGTFEEAALLAGVSVPDSGRPISSMGTDFQDYDNDGWEDIHVTALVGRNVSALQERRARRLRRDDAGERPRRPR